MRPAMCFLIIQLSNSRNVNKGIYYYTTYENHQITAVNMFKENLEGNQIIKYPLILEEQIRWEN